jgi:hypothetical protein
MVAKKEKIVNNEEKEEDFVLEDEVEDVKDYLIESKPANTRIMQESENIKEQIMEIIQEYTNIHGIEEGIVLCERVIFLSKLIKKQLYSDAENSNEDSDDDDFENQPDT